MLRVEHCPELTVEQHGHIAMGIGRDLCGSVYGSQKKAIAELKRRTSECVLFHAIDDISPMPYGLAAVELHSPESYVANLLYCWVHEDVRHTQERKGVGIGSLLVKKVIRVCEAQKMQELMLTTITPSREFYTSLRFEAIQGTKKVRKALRA